MGALPSVRKHSRGSIDDNIGIKYGLKTQGTLVDDLSYDATYEWTTYKGHKGAKDSKIGIFPEFKVAMNGKVKLLASGCNAKSPGYAFHKNFLPDVYPDIDHGNDIAGTTGYWIWSGKLKSGQGTLHEVSGEFEWFGDANDTEETVAAPSV